MLLAQQNIGMALKHLARHRVVILRGNRNHHAPLAQSQHHALKRQIGLAGGIPLRGADALHAIIANHPAPHGVIQIDDQQLLRLAAHRRNHPAQPLGINRQHGLGKGLLGHVPHQRIMPCAQANRLGQPGNIEQPIGRTDKVCGKRAVKSVNLAAQRPAQHRLETAHQHLGRAGQILDNHRR